MASTRERRANAGNKMSKLLNEEEEDDFYKTTYGGFEEAAVDQDYMLVYTFHELTYLLDTLTPKHLST